jgi:hypothetical protein
MKPINFLHVRFLLCLSIVWLGVSASATAQDFKTVHDGIEYAELTRTIAGQPVRMNLLRLDLTKVRFDVVHAMDMAIGTETVSSMAKRHGAFAAINAGFFRLDKSIWAGEAVGALKIDGQLLSESLNDRVALGIRNTPRRSEILLDRLRLNAALAYNDITRRFDGINREPKPKEIILFTPGMKTPMSDDDHFELELQDCRNFCKGAEIKKTHGGNVVIPDNFAIYFGPESDKEYLVEYFSRPAVSRSKYPTFIFTVAERPGDRLYKEFRNAEDIVAGIPLLMKKGKIVNTWEQEKASKSFVETRHPRTAVAKLKDGKFLMVTVDGRSESSGGLGLSDLAALLLEFGATDAMNLDGGGSTTMFLDGKVVNRPSDKEGERKVSDAIIVTLRNRPTSKKPVTSRK